MKTEKQIILKAKELGELYNKDAVDMDEIVVHEQDSQKWLKKLMSDTTKLYNMAPPLKEGVFTFVSEKYKGKLLFDCDIDESGTGKIDLISLYSPNNIDWIWDFQCVLTVSNILNTTARTDSRIRNYSDATIEIMGKQKKSEEKIIEYVSRIAIKNAEGSIKSFLLTNAWINYLMEHPQKKEIKRREKPSRDSLDGTKENTNDTNNKSPAAKRIINLNQITIRTSDEKTERRIISRKRMTFSWSVRGHMRHYKSGKTAYIKPYEKGTGNKRKKIYKT